VIRSSVFLGRAAEKAGRLRLSAAHHPLDEKHRQGACILPHGVLFRGNAEAVIRQQLILSGYLKAIIGFRRTSFTALVSRLAFSSLIKKTPRRARAFS